VRNDIGTRCTVQNTPTVDDSTVDQGFIASQFANLRTTIIPEVPLSDEEQQLWDNWDHQDLSNEWNQVSLTTLRDHAGLHANDTDDVTVDTATKATVHMERQNEAQKRLLEHARRAIVAVSGSIAPSAPAETAKVETTSTTVTTDHHATLEKFSYALRHEGVEVLKLNRWHKWQLRYLTVSREDKDSDDQLPKALLWLKQPNTHNYSAMNVKSGGRGGLMFSQLSGIEPVLDSVPDHPIPLKFREDFPIFAGVEVKYDFEGGSRSLHFCFKNRSDSMSFCLAMRIIKEVTKRITGQNDTTVDEQTEE
jgi:hypothetical protein